MNDVTKFGKVAVVCGGFSAEREVSLNSGRAVLNALLLKGVDAHHFDPQETDISNLREYDRVFNVLHGTFGEDGSLQGVLDGFKIPYTGCGVLASAIAMDKFRCRLVWQSLGLPNVPYVVLHDDSDFDAVEADFGLPLFVKPASEGSSVGVMMIEETGGLAKAYPKLKQYHGEILAEKAITGGEYACSLLGDDVLPSIRIIPKGKFYDYEAKYLRDDTVYQCPSDLTAEQEREMGELAKRAFSAMGGRGWSRVDFLKSDDGKLYVLEINTVPGMTDHSLVPMAAKEAGIEFADLCVKILEQTL
ncbi:D-alanine--D-alanine ligase [Moraxella bovis]|uniref:D-alanine--D-alanine ligase n=1 Tax=Moraxella bovis TaxID=476 RepID=A0AAQ2SZ52_MORBO|nr:D-alanine--D-alanine ligase [Moraxella bovis]AWY20961.1 D-alanine--D-alanine ligase [Moraxella bovis]UYZ76374.1 D-alanine--D-alanine ligase [Moraxella bovis]UYZ77674.1 D-alanine--D-alanine ligase [Moraxella bovis]UYZ81817.1 D-alanine--D-alanine ligase [Moraxella bovis]UYZ86160.1 D-alanine--D-alanine ligase [Moraxella bovis]